MVSAEKPEDIWTPNPTTHIPVITSHIQVMLTPWLQSHKALVGKASGWHPRKTPEVLLVGEAALTKTCAKLGYQHPIPWVQLGVPLWLAPPTQMGLRKAKTQERLTVLPLHQEESCRGMTRTQALGKTLLPKEGGWFQPLRKH
jgi:hypothetical protein